mgnify:CR=1 FL=1
MIWNRKNPYLAEIYECQLLSGEKSNREIRHYEIDLGNSKIKYEPGDSLGVIPKNNHELINSIISRLDASPSTIPDGYSSSLFDLLENDYEILTPTNRLIHFINENTLHKKLNDILLRNDKEALEVQSSFDKQSSGTDKFGKVKVTNKDLSYIQMAMSSTDLQLIEKGVITLRAICNVFGLYCIVFVLYL